MVYRSRRAQTALLILVSILSPSFCVAQANASGEEKLEELTSQAQSAQQRGDYAAAARVYETLSVLRPDIPEISANLGLMHQFMGDYAQADHDFKIALSKNAQLYVPNLFLGLNRLRDHQPRTALPYLKLATALNEQDEQAALGLARAYAAIAQNAKASHWFERALQINPRDSDAWYELGVSYLTLQDDAVLQLKKLNPNEVHARALVADAFLEQGRTREAIQIYEEFQSENHPPCLRSQLGLAYAQSGASEKAKETFQQEVNSNPGCLLAHIGLARLALTAGDSGEMLRQLHFVHVRASSFLRANLHHLWQGLDTEQVKSQLEQAGKQNSDQGSLVDLVIQSVNSGSFSPEAAPNLASDQPVARDSKLTAQDLWAAGQYAACSAKVLTKKTPMPTALSDLLDQCSYYAGDYHLTFETSERVLQAAPHNFKNLYWQAKSAQQLSTNSFAQMSAVAPDSPKVHLLMAQLHRAREEFPAAEAEYDAVLNARPSADEQLSARLGLAHVYFQTTEDDRSMEQLQTVTATDSSNADGNFLMGEILVRRHQYDDAIPHLRLAMQGVSPDFLPELHSLLAKCYSAKGNYMQALEEIKPALAADRMGDFHYQLYQVYQKLGDQKSAAAALLKSEQLRQEKSHAEQQHMLLSPR